MCIRDRVDQCFTRSGGSDVVRVDVRIISSTSCDLLVEHLTGRLAQEQGLPRCAFAADAMAVLQAYDWPGNVRQLRNIVERMMILGTRIGQEVGAEDLPQEVMSGGSSTTVSDKGDSFVSMPLREAREAFERDYLIAQINRFGGNVSRTASFIGMERSALHRKLKALGVSTSNRSGSRLAAADNVVRLSS